MVIAIKMTNIDGKDVKVSAMHVLFLQMLAEKYPSKLKAPLGGALHTVRVSNLSHFTYDLCPYTIVWAYNPCNTSLDGCLG